jgi:hypothetical protein
MLHGRGYDPQQQIKGTRAFKYTKIIKPLLSSTTTTTPAKLKPVAVSTPIQSKKGGGVNGSMFMKYKQVKPNYVYWNNVNELVERLQLLIASQAAGNNNHNNEIQSITEELREEKIIY